MSLADLARRFESLAATVSLGGRTLLGLDTNPVSREWNHITKIDPEGEKKLPLLYLLYLSHTSAVSIGGSQDVTHRNTEETFELLTNGSVTAFHEPSAASHVTETTRDRAAFTAVPEVLNGDSESLVGRLGKGIDYVREDLGPRMVDEKVGVSLDGLFGDRLGNLAAGWLMQESIFEAYIIMNTDSAAAREANVTEEDLLSPQEAKERALAAEYHLESEIIYLEYSGTFGGEEAIRILERIDDSVTWSRLWYGGGLDNREAAESVLAAGADAVVVGDIFHETAEFEADLCDRAREDLDPDVDRGGIREWIEETIDVENASATRYLSTIPDVPDPRERALRYLAASVETVLALEAIASQLDDPDRDDVRQALQRESVPGEAALAEVVDGDARTIAREVATALLFDRFDLSEGENAVADHLAVEL